MRLNRRQILLIGKVFSLISIIGLFVIVLYARQIGGIYPVYEHSLAYWRYRHAVDYSIIICLVILPLGIFVAFLQLFIWKKRWITPVLILSPIVLSCITLQFVVSNVLLTILGEYRHHDTYVSDNYIYHLSSEWKVGVGGASRAVYLLWQCNERQNSCTIIDSERILPIFYKQDYLNTDARTYRN